MKLKSNFGLAAIAFLLAVNLFFNACKKDLVVVPDQQTGVMSKVVGERSQDSIVYYKTMLAKIIAIGQNDPNFQTFFKRIAAKGEGNENGFSLWKYRDSLVSPNQSFAQFLASHSANAGYPLLSSNFFRGHLVRYIPNISIGLYIEANVEVANYSFTGNTPVVVLPSNYYTTDTDADQADSYARNLTKTSVDVENTNSDFLFIDENPYYSLFKTSNNKSLIGDRNPLEIEGYSSCAVVEQAFLAGDAKMRVPGTEVIDGQSVYLVDRSGLIKSYQGGGCGNDGGGGNDGGVTDRMVCERDDIDGLERIRQFQLTDGSLLKDRLGCKKAKNNCFFRVIASWVEVDNDVLTFKTMDKTVGLWIKGMRNGIWCSWLDIDNAFIKWKFLEGEMADMMNYRIIGKHVSPGATTTRVFGTSIGGTVKVTKGGVGIEIPVGTLTTSFGRSIPDNDWDFGMVNPVYYCDPIFSNNFFGETYSTGTMRIRVAEH